jgi:flagellar biogenesis protein FliO
MSIQMQHVQKGITTTATTAIHEQQRLALPPTPAQGIPLAARIIPPRTASRREIAALEAVMANLALDDRYPVALELVGDAHGVSLLVRAATTPALAHLMSQVQAIYPQARIDLLEGDRDPLRLTAGEAYSVIELRPGAPSYLSLRTWDTRAGERHEAEGTDPLLGVFSALQQLPTGTRAISQLAMLPARPTWSAPYGRKAVEHPLDPERLAERRQQGSTGPSSGLIIALAGVVAVTLVLRRFGTQLVPLVPTWMKQDAPRLLRGHVPTLTPLELLQLAFLMGIFLVGAWLLSRLVERLRGSHPLYDMRQVGEKTKRVAYRVHMRLIVIGERGDPVFEAPFVASSPSESASESEPNAAQDAKAAVETPPGASDTPNSPAAHAHLAEPQPTPPLMQTVGNNAAATLLAGGSVAPIGLVPAVPSSHVIADDATAQQHEGAEPDGRIIEGTIVSLDANGDAHASVTPASISATPQPGPSCNTTHSRHSMSPGESNAKGVASQGRTPPAAKPAIDARIGQPQPNKPAASKPDTAKKEQQKKQEQRRQERAWNDARTRARAARTREREQILVRLAASYRQYQQASGNYLVPRHLSLRHAYLLAAPSASVATSPGETPHSWWWTCRQMAHRLLVGKATWQKDIARSRSYLSVEELASLWHVPPEQDVPDIPFLEHGGARTRLVPQVLTERSLPQPETGAQDTAPSLIPYPLGTSTHAGQCWPVYVPRDVLHSNTLAVAATGKGKSTLFQHLTLAHLQANLSEGLFFMEPHGDTTRILLGAIPACRKDDVTLIDLADTHAIVSLNPLDMTLGIGRDKTVENILAVFVAFWKKQHSWGPRTENILQFALLTLAEANQTRLDMMGEERGALSQYTVLDIMPLLQQPTSRSSILKEVRDTVLLEWWTHYYNPMRQSFRDEVISPVVNKISKYAAAQVSRRLFGQSKATIRLRDDIAEGRTILVNTASGIVGEEVSALAGATLVGFFHAALAEQARLAFAARRRFLVFVDEFQTYLGINYPTMLAELRKYGGTFGLATQSLSYLHEVDPSLKATVLSNVDHLFAFAMSAEDAKALVPYLDGVEIADVLGLARYTCYARLTHRGVRLPTFSMQVAPSPPSDAEYAAWIVRHSQERHARPVGIVDDELAHVMRLPLTPMPKEADPVEDDLRTFDEYEQALPTGRTSTTNERQKSGSSGKRVRGERGKGADSGTSRNRTDKASGVRFDHPAVLSPHQYPRSHIWVAENALCEERGEPGGA